MNTGRKTAILVGAFFLTAMVTYLLGASIIESVLGAPDFLANVSANETQVVLGALLELINCLAVVGIAVTIYPIFSRHNEALAMGYVAFRVIEATLLVIAALSPLTLIALSQEYLTAGSAAAAYYQPLGAVLVAARTHLAGLLLTVFFSLGALMFYYFLYRSKLVPRWLSAWGLIAALLVLAWNLLETFGFSINAGIVFGLPIILNEITLGIWLIVKGFNPSVIIPESA